MADEHTTGVPGLYRPSAEQINHLLKTAADHPLGTDFLRAGALDAVAATFGAHAFTVEAARDELSRRHNGEDPAPAPAPEIVTARAGASIVR